MSLVIQKDRIKLIIFILIFSIIAIFGGIYMVAQIPYHEAREEAFHMSEKYAGVGKVNNFYIYNRDHTFYTIEGINSNNQEVYVVIPKKGNKINIFASNKGISAEKAKNIINKKFSPKKIIKITFGITDDNCPIWQVSYLNKNDELCYSQINFKNGKIIQTTNNL